MRVRWIILMDCVAADFGLAKIVPKESLLKTLCGTPGYCGKY